MIDIKYMLLLVALGFTSCKQNHINIDKENISKLSKGDFKTPSKYHSFQLFVKNTKGEIACVNNDILYRVYINDFKNDYKVFKEFLFEALNQNILFDKRLLEKYNVKSYAVNQEIKNEYQKESLTLFIRTFFTKKNNELILKKEYQNERQLFTILYYSFINNYYIQQDDNFGQFSINPW